MDALFDRWMGQIEKKSINIDNEHGCRLWLGACTQSGYGRKKLTFLDGSYKVILVHRVVYMCKYRSLHIPLVNNDMKDLELSHLCNNKLCVRSDHIVLESHSVNMERIHCFNQGICTDSHNPECLI